MTRNAMLRAAVDRRQPWDIAIIGGGATGMGIALDGASRDYSVILLEARDFGSGTSSRSTKLVHGGVRYLRNGQIGLVREALRERGILRRNAPTLVSDLSFIVPIYSPVEWAMYGIGLKLYDVLAGEYGFGRTEFLSAREVVSRLPSVRTRGLRGGILYHDGQADDARLLMQIAHTAVKYGATLLNYAPVVKVDRGRLRAEDFESGEEFEIEARSIINAAGPFSDEVRRLADPAAPPTVTTSQGAHIVVDGSFLPGGHALMAPKTSDGRVLFAIPWLGHTLVGTTDTPVPAPAPDPRPLPGEVEFILETAATCLERPPRQEDVLASFAGIRPLVRRPGSRNTAKLSRDHSIYVEPSGMITIVGGKWTTYRSMAQDCVDRAAAAGGLPPRASRTHDLPILPAEPCVESAPLHPALPYTEADVVHAVRHEMAQTEDDVLLRRTRAGFLNARATEEIRPRVQELIALHR